MEGFSDHYKVEGPDLSNDLANPKEKAQESMTILMEKVSIRQNGFDHSQGEGHNLDLTIPKERIVVRKENTRT